MNDYKLVYSTDPLVNRRCPQCKELVSVCTCAAKATLPDVVSAVLRLEKKGRGGKTVTVIAKLPRVEEFLKELCQHLKKRCGSGGTWHIDDNSGTVEIQGDKLQEVRTALTARGIKHKG